MFAIFSWIGLGLISGLLASKIVNRSGQGMMIDVVLGIVGATVGGFVFSKLGAPGISGLNVYSLVVATIGSIILLTAFHLFIERNALTDKLSTDPIA